MCFLSLLASLDYRLASIAGKTVVLMRGYNWVEMVDAIEFPMNVAFYFNNIILCLLAKV